MDLDFKINRLGNLGCFSELGALGYFNELRDLGHFKGVGFAC